jgi:hypothetical protein
MMQLFTEIVLAVLLVAYFYLVLTALVWLGLKTGLLVRVKK